MPEKIDTAKPEEAPAKQVYFSIGTNFAVQMTRPRKVVVDGEFITDHGKAITFDPIAGPMGASFGSRYATEDPAEIAFLDELCIADKLHVSKKYKMPPTARTAYNEDIEVLMAEERKNGAVAITRQRSNQVPGVAFGA